LGAVPPLGGAGDGQVLRAVSVQIDARCEAVSGVVVHVVIEGRDAGVRVVRDGLAGGGAVPGAVAAEPNLCVKTSDPGC
jgi:folate-dependent phosphoribosylglycinamide formyltransferase PurN